MPKPSYTPPRSALATFIPTDEDVTEALPVVLPSVPAAPVVPPPPPVGPPPVYQRGTAPPRKMKGVYFRPEVTEDLEAFAQSTHHAAGAVLEEAFALYKRVYRLAERKEGLWDVLNTWLDEQEAE